MTAEARVQDAIRAALPRTGDVVTGREVFDVLEAGLVALARDLDSVFEILNVSITGLRRPSPPADHRALELLRALRIPADSRVVEHAEWSTLPSEQQAQVYVPGGPPGCDFVALPAPPPLADAVPPPAHDECGHAAALAEIDGIVRRADLTAQLRLQGISYSVGKALGLRDGGGPS